MQHRILGSLAGIGIVLFILLSAFSSTSILPNTDIHTPRMKGVCWVGTDSITTKNFDPLLNTSGNWISQTPFAWMDGYDNPIINLSTHRAWWGETDRGIKHTTELAHKAGIQVMLKPHIWIMNSDGKWRHDIAMNSEAEWATWFENYEKFILHYARLSTELGIESLCIGTELYQTTKQYPDRWRKIIQAIKEIYCGELTYAANWYEEYETISFWDELDYIGIQSYFPLTKKKNPDVRTLVKGWKKHKKDIQKVANKFNKKVIFTELGFKNSADAAIEPWTWPQRMDKNKVERSDQTQINCYEAMFTSLWDEPWIDGFFIWKWFHTTYKHDDMDTYWEGRRDRQIYFSPQRTGAIDVLREWYSKEAN